MESISFIVFVLGLMMCGSSAQDDTDFYCNLSPEHTMCKYKDGVLGKACEDGAALIEITETDKVAIVKKHNELRSRVAQGNENLGLDGAQPSAANMMAMVWDDELAAVAKRWAMQCIYDHDGNADRAVRRFWVGQNAGKSWGAIPTWDALIQGWYNEVENMTVTYIPSFPYGRELPHVIGHYTQVVWATSIYVGCAIIQVQSSIVVHMFCNYGPAGNMGFQPIYIQGPAGSQCPDRSMPDSDTGLCV